MDNSHILSHHTYLILIYNDFLRRSLHELVILPLNLCVINSLFLPLECRDTQKGEAYIGKTSQTVDGRQCVRWDSVDDSHPDYFNVKFLTGSKSTHENYCRNPDNKIAPWCFTELVGGSWNYCNIPFCKRSKLINLKT